MTTKSCPECGQPLHAKLEAGLVTLWCAYGPCPSWVANDGATAPTAEEAFAKLSEAVEAERIKALYEEYRNHDD